jgi:hypothetical protein
MLEGSLCTRARKRPLIPVLAILCAAPLAAQAQVTRVSVTAIGGEANGASAGVSISADGRYVAFLSTASNLVTGDTNGVADVFVKDRQTGAVERVSVTTAGNQATAASSAPRISADGRFVVFTNAAALVAEDTNTCALTTGGPQAPCPDIYIRDRQAGQTTRVSLGHGDAQSDRASVTADVSADGRYVAFSTDAALPTNSVYSDLNGTTDVYVRDRQSSTTGLVSHVSGLGLRAGNRSSFGPRISADGDTVVFISTSTDLDPPIMGGDPPCEANGGPCAFAYRWTRTPEEVARLDLFSLSDRWRFDVTDVALSADGRTVVLTVTTVRSGTSLPTDLILLWPLDGFSRTVGNGLPGHTSAIDAGGRLLVTCPGAPGPATVHDVTLATSVTLAAECGSAAIAGLRFVAFSAADPGVVVGDTNAVSDVFVLDRDPDADGMPSEWETAVGLDPAMADALADADSDGVTNLAEYQAGSHPRGTYVRYLAEGAQTDFFTTSIDLFNPGTAAVRVVLRLLGESGGTTSLPFMIPPKTLVTARPSRDSFGLDAAAFGEVVPQAPAPSFSTVVEADRVVAVERSMSWGDLREGDARYGSHAETGVPAPQTTWYFAEGATAGAFDLFYLLENPTSTLANVTITYLLPAPLAPVVRQYQVAPNTRRTIPVDADAELSAAEISATIVSDQPILAERAMYLTRDDEVFAGGTGGAGLPAPALEWFVPEGATGTFFDLYVLVGNPNTSAAQLEVTYLLPDGTSFTKPYLATGQSRLSISVKGEDPRLLATAVSVVVSSMNNVPVVVERAMWWPSGDWYEGHASAATTAAAQGWALARGAVARRVAANRTPETRTYILIANPSSTPANVALDLVGTNDFSLGSGELTCQRTIPVAAHSRATFDIAAGCDFTAAQLGDYVNRIGGTIISDGPGIVVERSTYVSSDTRVWTAGESTLLTRLP